MREITLILKLSIILCNYFQTVFDMNATKHNELTLYMLFILKIQLCTSVEVGLEKSFKLL